MTMLFDNLVNDPEDALQHLSHGQILMRLPCVVPLGASTAAQGNKQRQLRKQGS